MLYRIKSRSICRQKQQGHFSPCLLYKFTQRLLTVERRIIHNYRTPPSRNLFEHMVGKLVLKKHGISGMPILFNSDMFPLGKATYDIHTLAVLPALGVAHLLTAFGVALFPL